MTADNCTPCRGQESTENRAIEYGVPALPDPETVGGPLTPKMVWPMVATGRFEADTATLALMDDLEDGQQPAPEDVEHLEAVAEYLLAVAEYAERSAERV